MSTVTPFFLLAARKEATAQVVLVLSAIWFVVVQYPLYYCLFSLPLALILLYLAIWVAHRVKILFHQDLDDIEFVYLSSEKCCFWVAEAHEEDGSQILKIERAQEDSPGGTGEVVGVVGVDVKRDPDMREPPQSVALLRRLAVSRRFQRMGLGDILVDLVLEHCARKGFRAVECLTTECHNAGRCLYAKKGFDIVGVSVKQYLLGLITITLYRYRKPCILDRHLLNIH